MKKAGFKNESVKSVALCLLIVSGLVEGLIITAEQPRPFLAEQKETRKRRAVNEEPCTSACSSLLLIGACTLKSTLILPSLNH